MRSVAELRRRITRPALPAAAGVQQLGAAVLSSVIAAALAAGPATAQPAVPPVRQDMACGSTWLDPAHPVRPDAHLQRLGMPRAWQLSRGSGQVIAIIDTGVAPHPRLPRLRGGGDLVAGGDGLADCDAHGTLVAGLAAAAPGPDGFSGIAPEAEIVSIRQSSTILSPVVPAGAGTASASDPAGRQEPAPGSIPAGGSGSITTLAAAIRAAADAGATVINVSEVACVPRGTRLDDADLTAALDYAVHERDIVVVAAAGNTEGACADSNPLAPDPRDSLGTDQVRTIVSPAWYDDLVLTVGATDVDGTAARFTVPGPWVDVAAPGVGLTSLSVSGPGARGPVPDIASAVVNGRGEMAVLDGTSFAAPVVAGVVALVRSRFPELTAPQVMDRISGTATGAGSRRGSDLRIGAGLVDPVAALSVPGRPPVERTAAPVPLAVSAAAEGDPVARARAAQLAAAGGAAVLVLAGALWVRRQASSRDQPPSVPVSSCSGGAVCGES